MGEGRFQVGVAHAVGVGAGRQVHADPIPAPDGDGRVGRLEQQPCAVLDRAAVLVGAMVGAVLQELIQQIAIGAVQLDAIEAGGLGVFSPLAEGLDDAGDLLDPERARGDERLFGPEQADPSLSRDGAGRHGKLAVQEHRIGDPSDMPDLHEDAAARGVDRTGDLFPAFHLRLRPDAGYARIADALRRDRHAFGDDHTGRRPLRIVFGHQRIGDLARAGAQPRQRRHQDTVRQGQVADDDRVEKRGHG